jgi:GTPase
MLERPQSGELALLVPIYFKKYKNEKIIKEFQELALAAGTSPVKLIT